MGTPAPSNNKIEVPKGSRLQELLRPDILKILSDNGEDPERIKSLRALLTDLKYKGKFDYTQLTPDSYDEIPIELFNELVNTDYVFDPRTHLEKPPYSLMTDEQWKKLSPADKEKFVESSQRVIDEVNQNTDTNEDSKSPEAPIQAEADSESPEKQIQPDTEEREIEKGTPVSPEFQSWVDAIRQAELNSAVDEGSLNYYDNDLEEGPAYQVASWNNIFERGTISPDDAEDELDRVAPRTETANGPVQQPKLTRWQTFKKRLRDFDADVGAKLNESMLEVVKEDRRIKNEMLEKTVETLQPVTNTLQSIGEGLSEGVSDVIEIVREDVIKPTEDAVVGGFNKVKDKISGKSDNNAPSPDGIDLKQQKEANTNKSFDKKNYGRIRITRKKQSTDGLDFSSLPKLLSFAVKKILDGTLGGVKEAGASVGDLFKGTRIGQMTSSVADKAATIPRFLGNLKTSIVHKMYEQPVFTAAGGVYRGVRLAFRATTNLASSIQGSAGIIATTALLTGFNPAAIGVVAAGSIGLNFANNIAASLARATDVSKLAEFRKADPLFFKEVQRLRLIQKMGGLENFNEHMSKLGISRSGGFSTMMGKILDYGKYANTLKTITGFTNWGGYGALLGLAIGTAFGNPLLGAAIGGGAGIVTKIGVDRLMGSKWMESLAGRTAMFRMLGSGALQWGMSYFQMVQSGEWAKKFLDEFRKKGFGDAWRDNMTGWAGVMNIANAGLFAYNAISLSKLSSSLITQVAAKGFTASGMGQIGSALGNAGKFLSSPGGIIGGIIGTGAGIAAATAFFGGGGGVALATAIAGGAIGGAIGSVIGGFIGGSIGSIALPFGGTVSGAYLGSFIGNTIGSAVGSFFGYGLGKAYEDFTGSIGKFVSSVMSFAGILSAINDLNWNSGWNISKMLALIIALIQLTTLVSTAEDGTSFFTDVEQAGEISRLNPLTQPGNGTYENMERLSYIYQDTVSASSDVNGISTSSYTLKKRNIVSETSYQLASQLERGYFNLYNKSETHWNAAMFSDWNDCRAENIQVSYICNSMIEYNENNLYMPANLIKDTFQEFGIDLEISSPQEFFERNINSEKFLNIKSTQSIENIQPGMVAFIQDKVSVENMKSLGIVDEITKDYIKTIEAGNKEIENYYILNFNGREISAIDKAGNTIVGFLQIVE